MQSERQKTVDEVAGPEERVVKDAPEPGPHPPMAEKRGVSRILVRSFALAVLAVAVVWGVYVVTA